MASKWPIDNQLTATYLQAMVRIDSVNPGLSVGGAGEGAVAAWLAQTCREIGLSVELQDSAPGRPNVIAKWAGTGGGRSLLLTGHTDVVSVENMEGNPFDARIEDGRLYGRGSYDMKGGLASILGAVAALKTGGFQPSSDIFLGFVTDEEYLSIGTDALVKAIHPDAAILTEPTGNQLCIAHKGFAWYTITTYGKATHGSLYMEGVDAIVHMGRVIGEIERLERDVLPERHHPLLGRPSVHASLINGGLGLTTYPDRCSLQIEHRLLPDETALDVLGLWQSVLDYMAANVPDFRSEVKLDFDRPGYEIERGAAIVQALETAYVSVTGKTPEVMGQYAWLDSAILGRANIPTVIIGPDGAGAHAAVEWVDLESVYQCAAVLAEATANWTG